MGKTLPSVVSGSGIDQAAAGNPALRTLLQQLTTAANAQATKTSTSGKNPPNQSSATVVFANPYYDVTFTDPGGATASSPAQAAQQAALSSLGSNPVQSSIYHQVQAATSVLFDAANLLHTYGGDTGSLQTQFILSDLDSTHTWYFRIRTSYDGQSWNQWKILNNKGLKANTNAVVKTGVLGGYFAAITLPGSQTVGFGIGQIGSGLAIETASGVLIENTIGIAGPATTNDTGSQAIGVNKCSIDANGVITMNYRAADSTVTPWTGNANFLTFGWVEGNQALAEQTLSDGGVWVVMTVAGGARIAIGSGVTAAAGTFTPPTGFTAANMMAVCTPASVIPPNGHDAHGIKQSNVVIGASSATPTVVYGDGSGNTWQGSANWFAIAWEPALSSKLVTVTGGQYLLIPTPSGIVAIGTGSMASGAVLPLPPGYTYAQTLAFGLVDGYANIGAYMHGVAACTVNVGLSTSDGTGYALYTNGTTEWAGMLDWFAVSWL